MQYVVTEINGIPMRLQHGENAMLESQEWAQVFTFTCKRNYRCYEVTKDEYIKLWKSFNYNNKYFYESFNFGNNEDSTPTES